LPLQRLTYLIVGMYHPEMSFVCFFSTKHRSLRRDVGRSCLSNTNKGFTAEGTSAFLWDLPTDVLKKNSGSAPLQSGPHHSPMPDGLVCTLSLECYVLFKEKIEVSITVE
jgi:hypothetical protein